MMRKSLFIKIIIFLLLSSCSNSEIKNDETHKETPYVVLVSIDGFRYDYVKKFRPKNLSEISMISSSEGLIPVFPSKTFPNHFSLVTGLRAGKHEIVANKFLNPDTNEMYQLSDRSAVKNGKWYKGEPLWIAAKKQKMITASFFWVGTDANIQNQHPTYYKDYNGSISNIERVSQVVKWLKLPQENRPHLILLYFSLVDTAGHRFGPDSNEVKNAVLEVDDHIGVLRNEFKKLNIDVNLVIVSDHGMQKISPESSIYLPEFVRKERGIRVVGGGTHTMLYFSDKSKIINVYNRLKNSSSSKYFDVYLRSNIPKYYGIHQTSKSGDIIISTKSPYYLITSKNRPRSSINGGTHGYDSSKNQNMWGVFLAEGPQINSKKIGPIENIHVYPFIMNLLKLDIKTQIDGEIKYLGPLIKK